MKYIDAEKLIAELTKMQFELNAAYRKPQSDNIVRAISLEIARHFYELGLNARKKIYCIVEQGWDGIHYSPDDVYCFSTEEKRDAAYKRLEECPAYKKADIDLLTFESELDKD